jgi:hypothetical protein
MFLLKPRVMTPARWPHRDGMPAYSRQVQRRREKKASWDQERSQETIESYESSENKNPMKLTSD